MANFKESKLTNAGYDLLVKVIAGQCELQYTKIAIGDGELGSADYSELTSLVNEKLESGITRADVNEDTSATIGGAFSNEGLTEIVYIKELGVYALDPDEGEILYCYTTAEGNPNFLGPSNTTVIFEEIEIQTYISTVENIVANIIKPLNARNVALEVEGINSDNVEGGFIDVIEVLGDIENRTLGVVTVDFYVDGNLGDDSNNGFLGSPVKTINKAVELAKRYTGHRAMQIHISEGVYTEDVVINTNHAYISLSGNGNNTNVIINGSIVCNRLQMVHISDITINVQDSSKAGIQLIQCSNATIWGVVINQITYGNVAGMPCVWLQQTKALLRDNTLYNSGRAVVAQNNSSAHCILCTIDKSSRVADCQTGSKIALQTCTESNYGALYTIQAGCYFARGDYGIALTTASIIN